MAPRLINFKPNSIVYFNGDKADSVYLLKKGKVFLVYNDIQSGEEIQDQINAGEFFGVKSGLIKLQREETAKVVVDSSVIEFSSVDFEALITKNTNIIIKMLRSFSSQLRRVGKQVQDLVTTERISQDTKTDFFLIGDYYLKNRKYSQAITVYTRFLNYYSGTTLAQVAEERKKTAKVNLSSYGDGAGPAPVLSDVI